MVDLKGDRESSDMARSEGNWPQTHITQTNRGGLSNHKITTGLSKQRLAC